MAHSIIIQDGDSRVRVNAPVSEGLTPKTGEAFMDLRGEQISPSLRDWRSLPPDQLELMQQRFYEQRSDKNP